MRKITKDLMKNIRKKMKLEYLHSTFLVGLITGVWIGFIIRGG